MLGAAMDRVLMLFRCPHIVSVPSTIEVIRFIASECPANR